MWSQQLILNQLHRRSQIANNRHIMRPDTTAKNYEFNQTK